MQTPSFLTEDYFHDIRNIALKSLKHKEHLFINFAGENSQFIRINSGKVRQIGTVEDAYFDLTLLIENSSGELRKGSKGFTISGDNYRDKENVQSTIVSLRSEVEQLPVDLYAELPKSGGSSFHEKKGNILDHKEAAEKILAPLGEIDMAGIYAGGTSIRAMANSAGETHWFSSQSFSFDYSFYTLTKRALKGTFAQQNWSQSDFLAEMQSANEKTKFLEAAASKISKGSYRTYLAPAAVDDLIQMFSWGCISEAAIQQGDSPLRHVRSGERRFSPLFQLSEDFSGGDIPRFNSEGELAPERLTLINGGVLKSSLISSRTAKEYNIPSNFATSSETMRSPNVSPGQLVESQILQHLGEGLYLSNLHYLNWSDQPGGRITGMTRYACFWIENGKIVCPIENMRWDDSIFRLFGSELLDFTLNRSFNPNVGTYGLRSLGGSTVPGMLVKNMEFTL